MENLPAARPSYVALPVNAATVSMSNWLFPPAKISTVSVPSDFCSRSHQPKFMYPVLVALSATDTIAPASASNVQLPETKIRPLAVP